MTSVNHLTYMLACLNEALRVYPPVPAGLPRVTPAGGRTILGRFVPQGVSAANQHCFNHKSLTYLITDNRCTAPLGIVS
jgi:hypothetical protein